MSASYKIQFSKAQVEVIIAALDQVSGLRGTCADFLNDYEIEFSEHDKIIASCNEEMATVLQNELANLTDEFPNGTGDVLQGLCL